MFVALEDGRKDLMPAITYHYYILLFQYWILYYRACFTPGNQINIGLVKQNHIHAIKPLRCLLNAL